MKLAESFEGFNGHLVVTSRPREVQVLGTLVRDLLLPLSVGLNLSWQLLGALLQWKTPILSNTASMFYPGFHMNFVCNISVFEKRLLSAQGYF